MQRRILTRILLAVLLALGLGVVAEAPAQAATVSTCNFTNYYVRAEGPNNIGTWLGNGACTPAGVYYSRFYINSPNGMYYYYVGSSTRHYCRMQTWCYNVYQQVRVTSAW